MKTVALFVLLTLLLTSCGDDSATTVPDLTGKVIHVALDGFNSNPGTATEPVLTMDQAMELARQGQGQTIKVASGIYRSVGNQNWDITGGVDIIGGCDRFTWEPVAGAMSEIQIFLRPIKGLDIRTPTLIRGLDLVQRLEGDPSSNALYLFGCSEDLVFSGCRFTAADGAAGESGRNGDDGGFDLDESSGQPGQPGTCEGATAAAGGQGGTFQCSGGRGGAGGPPGQPGENGANGSCSGAGGGTGGALGSDGLAGQDGLAGENGGCGGINQEIGYFEGSSFLPFDSDDGDHGSDGQPGGGGGGGGGSISGTGNGGGGGGSAGDRGWIGRGGRGGGHSIALICVNSTAIFQDCQFLAGDGGAGGNGGNGGAGSAGGSGGPGESACSGEVGRGGRGGDGGTGGSGGGGGGGNGGCSIAVFLSGNARPVLDESCLYLVGEASSGGTGGMTGDGSEQAPAGLPGLAVARLDQVETDGKN